MLRDTDYYDLDFDCPRCPPQCGIVMIRVSHAERLRLSPEHTPYRCARGHKLTWTGYRGFYRVDDNGFTIDAHHPEWKKSIAAATGLNAAGLDELDREYWGPSKES